MMMLSSVLSIMPAQAQQTTKSSVAGTTGNANSMTSSESTTTTTASDDDAIAKTTLPELTHELVTEILQYKGIYAEPEEEEICRVRGLIIQCLLDSCFKLVGRAY
eukprot:scaffold3402_cov169-Amphora_coffeaeformis.AAC.2